MSVTITNKHNLPESLVEWLSHDAYDYDSRSNARSASSLIKSPKKAKLTRLVTMSKDIEASWDIMDTLGAHRGTAIHDSIEQAANRLVSAGFDIIQELRLEHVLEVDGVIYIITGKFDALENQVLTDWKTESTYSWGDPVKLRERCYQLSIYAWLCHRVGIPCSHTLGKIISIFNDWSRVAAAKSSAEKYPSQPIMAIPIKLMQRNEIEEYMRNQIREERDLTDPNSKMCTREELWLKPAVWSFFSKPENVKASKNFEGPTALFDANTHKQLKGGGGIVKEKPQKAKACNYCLGRFKCDQYEILKSQGLIDED